MQIYVSKIDPHADDEDYKYIVVNVSFRDDINKPAAEATVTIYVPKGTFTLAELEAHAIQKANTFLSLIVSGRFA